jgi:hypothetical protein
VSGIEWGEPQGPGFTHEPRLYQGRVLEPLLEQPHGRRLFVKVLYIP